MYDGEWKIQSIYKLKNDIKRTVTCSFFYIYFNNMSHNIVTIKYRPNEFYNYKKNKHITRNVLKFKYNKVFQKRSH